MAACLGTRLRSCSVCSSSRAHFHFMERKLSEGYFWDTLPVQFGLGSSLVAKSWSTDIK